MNSLFSASVSLPYKTPFPKQITESDLLSLVENVSTPFFIYDEFTLREKMEKIKNFLPDRFKVNRSFTPRYAVKANSNRTLVKLLNSWGIHFDASSVFEVERLVKIGIDPKKIMLTAQEWFSRNEDMMSLSYFGEIYLNASSLHQLEVIGQMREKNPNFFRNPEISVRINPGRGSGFSQKTDVGGENSGFGIWYEKIDKIKKICEKYDLVINRVHTHIGSGADPLVWSEVAETSLKLLTYFPKAHTLNLGGGFKVARNPDEVSTDLDVIGERIEKAFQNFEKKTDRRIHLELEPGTYYVATAGLLVSQVVDLVSTSKFSFIKLDTGMNDLIRPSLYQANHHIDLLKDQKNRKAKNIPLSDSSLKEYLIIGHCCESSDLFSISDLSGEATNSNDRMKARLFPEVEIGDYMVIHGVGAYGTALSSHYNSFPFSAEFLKRETGKIFCIRKRGTIEDVIKNEIEL